MESLNELQRDFRKGIHKMLNALQPLSEDAIVQKIHGQILNRKHYLNFEISEHLRQNHHEVLSQLTSLEIPEFEVLIDNHIENKCSSAIYSTIQCKTTQEYQTEHTQHKTFPEGHLLLLFTDDLESREKLGRMHRRIPQIQVVDLPNDNLGSWLPEQHFFLQRIFKDAEQFLQRKAENIQKVLTRKSQIQEGKLILNKSQEISFANDRSKKIQKKIAQVKNRMSNQIRKEYSQIDQTLSERLNPDSDSFKELMNEIISYRGFNEQDDSRNTTYSIPDEYVHSVKIKLRDIYADHILSIQEQTDYANQNIINALQNLNNIGQTDSTFEVSTSFPTETIQKALDREESTLKKYEKAVPKKGIYQLLMELRTPLYIIFPLFIIARFINTSDEGAIDKNLSSLSGEPIVIISQLPESYNNNEQKFIAALNKQLNNGELVNQITGEEIFKYRLDSRRQRKQVIYYLIPNQEEGTDIAIPIESDRSLAIELLENGLLKISKRFNVISELQKIPLIFGPFKNLFGPVVLILVIWFVKSRRDRMRKERETIRRREEQSLLKDLKKDIYRLTNAIESVCSNQIKAYARGVTDELSHAVEKWKHDRLRKEEFQSAKNLKLIKERHQYFQGRIKEFSQSKKTIYEASRELMSALRK